MSEERRDLRELYESPAGMTPIVKTVVRFVIGIIVLFGAYIVLYGHLTPGGGFAGGVILACGYVILTLAFGKGLGLRKMSDMAASVIDNSAALAFVLIGLFGYVGGYFFYNFIEHGNKFDILSSGIILCCNIIIGLKVTSSLFAVFIALSIFGRFISKLVDEEEYGREQ